MLSTPLRRATPFAAILLAPAAYSAIHYVGASGGVNDSSSSPASPFATIAHAVSVASANDTIEILPGTHSVSGPILNIGKRLTFSGTAGSSTIRATYIDAWPAFGDQVPPAEGRHIFNLVAGADGSVFQHLSFDGVNRQAGGAILVAGADNVRIDDCNFTWFGARAVWLKSSSGHIVRHSYFGDCGGETYKGSSGMLSLLDIEDSDFHDLELYSNPTGGQRSSGYGIKCNGVTRRCRFFNLSVDLRAATWFNNQSADTNFALELHNGTGDMVEIFDSYFRNTVSLAHGSSGPGAYSIRFHHNTLNPKGFYAVETGTPNLLVDRNYCMKNAFARCWHPCTGLRIIGNVAENLTHDFFSTSPSTPNIAHLTHNGVKIYNNTAYFQTTNGTTRPHNPNFASHGWSGVSNNWEIRNNIAVGASGSASYEVDFLVAPDQLPTGLQISNNRLWRGSYSTAGYTYPTSNTLGDPGLVLAGAKPNPYYQPLASGSFVRDNGHVVGVPYSMGGPDRGAIEYGFNPLFDFSFDDALPAHNPDVHARAFGADQALPPPSAYRGHAILRQGTGAAAGVRTANAGQSGAGDHTFRSSVATAMGIGAGDRNTIVPAEDVDPLRTLQKFTLTGWIKPNNITVGGGAVIAGLCGPDGTYHAVLGSYSSGRADLYVNGGSPAFTANNFFPSTSEWMFFAVTYDGSLASNNVKFYIGNGTTAVGTGIVRTLDKSAVNAPAGSTWCIGNNINRDRAFGGHVNNIAIYPAVLGQWEVDAIRNLWK